MITFKQHLSEARKKQNPADYPRVQNASAGRKRKVMFSDDKPKAMSLRRWNCHE